ncbi:VOC family protein [Streptomyces sp. NPDC001941]|uniref:VOC family protein n=1 Tax=Streptomyces sp. NPDC001941 TaxID=3154659 RepID=UPI00331F3D68
METMTSFVHHLGVFASDFEASERFYTASLAALGIGVGHRDEGVAEYWSPRQDTPSLSLERAPGGTEATQGSTQQGVTRGVHIAFAADGRDAVDAFHAAAVAAGGTSRHAPRAWPEYRAYCAFVSDPDGNNIEAVHKEA